MQLSHSVLQPNDCDACQVLNLTLSKKYHYHRLGAGIVSLVQWVTMGWRVQS